MSNANEPSMNSTDNPFQNPIIQELHAVREQLWQQAGENYTTAIAQAHENTKAISATMRHIQSQPRKVTEWHIASAQ